MKKSNFVKRGMFAIASVICSAMMLVSCVEEEITPESQLLVDDVIVIDDGNGNNDNADGPRGKDHDTIDIDVVL